MSRPTRITFLDPALAVAALAEAAERARASGVQVALAGGLALQLYGSTRLTADVDLVADGLPIMPRRPAGKMLTFGGEATVASNGVPVDYIVRADGYAPLYQNALLHARRVAGVPVPVVTLPYLAAMKLVAGRAKDHLDLHFVILTRPKSYKNIRRLVVEQLGEFAGDELDRVREDAELEATRARRRR